MGRNHDGVRFVTDGGRLFRINGYTIAEGSRTSGGHEHCQPALQLEVRRKGHQHDLPAATGC